VASHIILILFKRKPIYYNLLYVVDFFHLWDCLGNCNYLQKHIKNNMSFTPHPNIDFCNLHHDRKRNDMPHLKVQLLLELI